MHNKIKFLSSIRSHKLDRSGPASTWIGDYHEVSYVCGTLIFAICLVALFCHSCKILEEMKAKVLSRGVFFTGDKVVAWGGGGERSQGYQNNSVLQ